VSRDLESLIESWNGFAVVARYDSSSGTWIFICLHDKTLGPCSGGTRIKSYATPSDGLLDAMRLAQGMTDKWAAAGLPYGGGKAVLAIDKPLVSSQRRELLLRYGELVESLGGVFQTGEDLGTRTEDLVVVSERTRFVHGFNDDGSKADPSPYTARGVYVGLCAALETALGSSDPAGRSVLVQGVGNVGLHLARSLTEAKARLLLSDIDTQRLQEAADELDAVAVAPEDVYATSCDVYAPCAVGATLNRDTIPRLRCRVVAGSANNQLSEDADAERLEKQNIVWAPDFIINAGGAIAFALMHQESQEHGKIVQEVERIGATVGEVLGEARAHGLSSLAAAKRRVDRELARARPASSEAKKI
jgi:leucine dehydrogenase